MHHLFAAHIFKRVAKRFPCQETMSSSATEFKNKTVGRPKKTDDPESFKLANGTVVTLEDIITASNGCTHAETAAKLGTNPTMLRVALRHLRFANWTAFRKSYPSNGNAVGPAPGNGAAAVDSAPGNGAPRAPSPLFPPQESDEQTWTPSPCDEKESNEALAGDEGIDDDCMSIDNVHPPTEGEHNVAPLLEPSGSDALSDNTATTNGYTPWPFANITNLNPTDSLPWDFWRKV